MKIHFEEINIDSTHILLKTDIKNDIKPVIIEQRRIIEEELLKNQLFGRYEPSPIKNNPKILRLMTTASQISDTGPMSSVAGSINEVCLEYLEKYDTKFTIIENGGDIALKTYKKSFIALFAGNSPYSESLAFKLKAKKNGYGVCTSSGTFGHSKSFGESDATIVFAKNASIADSLATRIGNYANGEDDESIVNNAMEKAEDYREYFDGVMIIKNDMLAKIGHIPKIVKIEGNNY